MVLLKYQIVITSEAKQDYVLCTCTFTLFISDLTLPIFYLMQEVVCICIENPKNKYLKIFVAK